MSEIKKDAIRVELTKISRDGTPLIRFENIELIFNGILDLNNITDEERSKILELPTGTEYTTALINKVDKDGTKVLSTNDFTDILNTKLTDLPDNSTLTSLLDGKVNKDASRGLSTNDFTDALNTKLTDLPDNTGLTSLLDGKVDKDGTKGLSTNDFTDTLNTKLTDLPDNTGLTTLLDGKVDKDGTKGLSTNDFTDALNTKLTDLPDNTGLTTLLDGKVDKDGTKGLSTNDFTDALKTSLENLNTGDANNAKLDQINVFTNLMSIDATKPELRFMGDVNTWGLYNENNDFIISNITSALDLIKLSNDGKIGLGGDYDATAKLQLTSTNGVAIKVNTDTFRVLDNGIVYWGSNDGLLSFNTGNVSINSANNNDLIVNSDKHLVLSAGGNEHARLTNGGSLLIGTDTGSVWKTIIKSQYPLQIKDSNNTAIAEYYADLKENRYLNGTKIVGYANNLEILTSEVTDNILLQKDGGNVAIGKASASELLDVNGTVQSVSFKTTTGTANEFLKADGTVDDNIYSQNIINTSNVNKYQVLDAHYSGGHPEVGAIRIKLPQLYTGTMLKMYVSIFNYNQNKTKDYIISGYTETGSGGTWFATSATCISDEETEDLNVRFGDDGTSCVVWIGELTTSWSYPKVVVHEVIASHNNTEIGNWETGWAISLENTAFDTVEQTVPLNTIRPLKTAELAVLQDSANIAKKNTINIFSADQEFQGSNSNPPTDSNSLLLNKHGIHTNKTTNPLYITESNGISLCTGGSHGMEQRLQVSRTGTISTNHFTIQNTKPSLILEDTTTNADAYKLSCDNSRFFIENEDEGIKFKLEQNGNIGIGDNITPTAKLHIIGGTLNTDTVFKTNDKFKVLGDGQIYWGVDVDTTEGGILTTDATNTIIGARGTQDLQLHTDGTAKVTIKQDGRFGVGLDPVYSLDVTGESGSTARIHGATQATVNLQANTTNNYIVATTTGFSFRPLGTERIRIGANGLGIGVSTISYPLHILNNFDGASTVGYFSNESTHADAHAQIWVDANANNSYLRTYNSAGTYGARFDIGSTAGGSYLTISPSGTERARFTTDGKFGLGVAPASLMHIYENTNHTDAQAGLTIEQDGNGNSQLQFLLTGVKRWAMGLDQADSNAFKIAENQGLGSDTRLSISEGGAVNFYNTVTSNNTYTGTGFIVSGGTTSQFLKADGSIDSNTYLETGGLSLDGANGDNTNGVFNANAISSNSNTTGSVNYPHAIGQTWNFQGATVARSFSIFKENTGNDLYFRGWNSASSLQTWKRIATDTDLATKVDVDGTKVLSDNNYDDATKTKVDGIETGAQVNAPVMATGSPNTITGFWVGTVAEYDAIVSPDPTVMYFKLDN